MREIQLHDGRRCVLHGTGVRGGTTDGRPTDTQPEIVEYACRGAAGQCALPGDWAAQGDDALRSVVERAAHYAITGAVRPFDGPNGDAVRDLVVAAARLPSIRLRTLATATARRDGERRTVAALVNATGERLHAAGRLPAYLVAAASVVVADRALSDPAPSDRAETSATEVAQAVGPAATALLVSRRPGRHDHSALARAYRALVAPFHE